MEKLTAREQVGFQRIKEFIQSGMKLTTRALQESLGYASPRSITLLFEHLIDKGWIYRDLAGHIQLAPNYETDSATVVHIPLIGSIACGIPIFAEENVETMIPVSEKLVSRSAKYFFLRAE